MGTGASKAAVIAKARRAEIERGNATADAERMTADARMLARVFEVVRPRMLDTWKAVRKSLRDAPRRCRA